MKKSWEAISCQPLAWLEIKNRRFQMAEPAVWIFFFDSLPSAGITQQVQGVAPPRRGLSAGSAPPANPILFYAFRDKSQIEKSACVHGSGWLKGISPQRSVPIWLFFPKVSGQNLGKGLEIPMIWNRRYVIGACESRGAHFHKRPHERSGLGFILRVL